MLKSARHQLICAALLLAATLPTLPALAQSLTPPASAFPWWKSEPFKKELGLSADQSSRIDTIWETTRPELRAEWNELSALEAKLSHLIQKDADEALLSRQIDRVEGARANANKTRSLMLVQMLKVLTPDQRVRFKTLHERWQQDRHRDRTEGRSDRGSDGGSDVRPDARPDGRSEAPKSDQGRRPGSSPRQPQ
jgi:Spy/CpxP family protein refolding chaperone